MSIAQQPNAAPGTREPLARWFRHNVVRGVEATRSDSEREQGIVEDPSRGMLNRIYLLVALQCVDFVALLATLLVGWWDDYPILTVPAMVIFAVSIALVVLLTATRGHRIAHLDAFAEELRQAQTRLGVSTLIEAYAIAVLPGASPASEIYLAAAFTGLAVMLVPLILFLIRPGNNTFARFFSAITDQCCATFLLLADRPYAMAVWPVYLWVSFGHGFRFGVKSLLYAAFASLVLFGIVVAKVPSWHARPSLTAGLLFALISLPLYASALIRQLHLATAAAKKANEAKTRFIAVMSHELRTPLSAMLGTVGVLRNSELDDDQKRLLHVITGSGQSLLSMINELLDFSAIDSGKTHLEIRDVQIYDLLNTTVNSLSMAAEEKGLRLAAHIDCHLPRTLRTDSEHVRRIITNLVWNAIKFTKVGRVDVSLSLAAGRDQLVIEVEDTGVGIPPDKQAKIFEPFVQGDDRVERVYEGVGLGLAIVRELVSLHRGKVSLKSQVGVGSRFAVELPVRVPAAMEVEGTAQDERVAFIAGSGPLTSGGLLDACRSIGLSCSFVDLDPSLIRRTLEKAKSDSRPVVFLSHRDMATGARVPSSRFEDLVALIEAEKGIPILVIGDADSSESVEGYRNRVPATLKGVNRVQLVNSLYFADLSAPTRVEPDTVNYTPQKPCRILLVEDNATNRFITSRAMSEAGHEVIAVPGGDEALNALDRAAFDVVIMDINMPGLNGFEATKIIRTINYSDKLRIIGLTADATTETRRKCLEAGMDLVLTKPASIPHMLKAIDELVTHGVASAATEKVTSIEANSRFRARRAAVVDDNGFQRLKDIGGASFILESVTLFLAEAVDLIGELETALNAYDRAQAYDIFHSLKGICANVGAMRLREAVNTVRDADNLVSDRYAHVGRLREELKTFQTEITKRVPDLEVVPLPFG